MIHFLLRDASRLESAARVLEPRFFADPQIREVYEWLLADGQNRDVLSAEALSALTVIEKSEREFGEGDRAFDDIVADLQIRPVKAQERRLQRAMRQAGDDEQLKEQLFRDIIAIQEQQRQIEQQAKLGFKATRYRAIRMRMDNPVTGQGE